MSSILEQIVSRAKSVLICIDRFIVGEDVELVDERYRRATEDADANERYRVAMEDIDERHRKSLEDLAVAKRSLSPKPAEKPLIEKEPWKAPTHLEVDGRKISLGSAWKLCLSTYSGINPAYIADLSWDGERYNEGTQRKIKDAYYRAVPGNPTIELYGKESCDRNRVHYFLSSRGLKIKDPVSSANHDQTPLAWILSYYWFEKNVLEIQNSVKPDIKKYDPLLQAMGLKISDIKIKKPSAEDINRAYLNALHDHYIAGDENPWTTAAEETKRKFSASYFGEVKQLDALIDALEADEKTVLHAFYFNGEKGSSEQTECLKQQGLQKLKYRLYVSGLLRKNAFIEEFPSERGSYAYHDIETSRLDKQVEKAIVGIEEQTRINEYRVAARKQSRIAALYLDLLGDSKALIRAAYKEVLSAWKEDTDTSAIDLEHVARQTAAIITYRLENGWLVVTPQKQEVIFSSLDTLRGTWYKEVIELRYGLLQDGKTYNKREIAALLGKSEKSATTIISEAQRNLRDRLGLCLSLMRQGATDDDIHVYRKSVL